MKRFVLLVAMAGVVACGTKEKSITDTTVSVAGTYALQSVNNDPVPSNYNDAGNVVVISAGTLTMNANGSFSYSETWSTGADVTTGVWSKTGDTYTFVPDAKPGEGAQSNGVATITADGTMTLTVQETSQTTVRVLQKS
ncbi:MAG TPA: hypothetical protein VF483_11605 [Gemmatimonadaceae bacterium]